MNQAVLDYHSERQCSSQWKAFLHALAEEFSGQLSDTELRALMRRIGSRFASQISLGTCNTLDELQLSMSRIWFDLNWGWVTVEEYEHHLRIQHNCAPLQAAFGEKALAWTPAFLEGVYQKWFQLLGSSEELTVRQTSDVDASGCVEFRFGRP